MTALHTRKMMPESAFLFMAMEEWTLQTHRQQASKVFIKEKQIAPRTAGMGEKSPCSLLSYRGFYRLKIPTWGPERCGFLHWTYSSTYISPCPIGVLGLEMSGVSSMVSLSFSFLWLETPFLSFLFYQLRSGLEYNKQSGVGGEIHISYNKMGSVEVLLPGTLKPQKLINIHKERIHVPTLTTWVNILSHTHCIWKFPGQELTQHLHSDLSLCSLILNPLQNWQH